MGGRKMQEALRQLREEWKQTDQGGLPNHGLWKRFDQACNRAHKVVETWLDKVRAESAEHRAHRLALIDELKAWATAHAAGPDWKAVNRALYQFSDRWREAGIFWGVGRGSSVCSLVLHKIGINRINPMDFDLEPSEWLK